MLRRPPRFTRPRTRFPSTRLCRSSAFNTPRFDWARSHMPRRAQPVPPIFQPEIAARGIVWASKHRRREVCVGWPAVKAIWGNKLMPRFADRLLARQGYDGQMTGERQAPDAPDNLYEPVVRSEEHTTELQSLMRI